MRLTAAVRASARDPLLQVAKTALATIVAWIVCDLVIADGPPPVFGAIAAMLVVQPSLNQSLAKGVERSVGVVAGVFLATGMGVVLGTSSWVVLLAVSAALVLSWALRLTTGSGIQIAISALLVLTLGASTPDYAFIRIVETMIGAVIGIVVHLLLVPPVALAPLARRSTCWGRRRRKPSNVWPMRSSPARRDRAACCCSTTPGGCTPFVTRRRRPSTRPRTRCCSTRGRRATAVSSRRCATRSTCSPRWARRCGG